jgi:hypothetical protein
MFTLQATGRNFMQLAKHSGSGPNVLFSPTNVRLPTLLEKGFEKDYLQRDKVLPRTVLIRRRLFGRQTFFLRQTVLPRTFY